MANKAVAPDRRGRAAYIVFIFAKNQGIQQVFGEPLRQVNRNVRSRK